MINKVCSNHPKEKEKEMPQRHQGTKMHQVITETNEAD
jgi:hypothetical protein